MSTLNLRLRWQQTMWRLRSLKYYLAGVAGLRANDILLSSFPRSGSTWLRFIFCNLISLEEWNGRPVDFYALNQTMVEFGASNLMRSWSHPTLPRIVKTHRNYLWLFRKCRAIGLVRDPRDVMISYYHYERYRQNRYHGSFSDFLRNKDVGLETWFKHYASWQDRWVIMIRYEDLKQDTFCQVQKLLRFFEIDHKDSILREAIKRSDIEQIRNVEKHDEAGKDKKAQFARSGRTKQWTDYFTEQDSLYYSQLAKKYNFSLYQ